MTNPVQSAPNRAGLRTDAAVVGAGTSTTLTGLTHAPRTFVRVAARNTAGRGTWTAPGETTIGLPVEPASLTTRTVLGGIAVAVEWAIPDAVVPHPRPATAVILRSSAPGVRCDAGPAPWERPTAASGSLPGAA